MCCVCLCLAACSGQITPPKYSSGAVGLGVSTMGVTVEPSVRFSDNTGGRALMATGQLDANRTIDGISYNADLTVGGVGVMGDYFPGNGPLRLSGGVLRHSLSLDGRATGTQQVGGTTYANVDLTSRVTPKNDFLPMAAIGIAKQVSEDFSISVDVGAIYVGEYSVTASDQTGTISASDLQSEVSAMEDELNQTPIVPYIRIGGAIHW